ncbi:hypothetical protein [Antribacter gilvus]|uniref:hypothetical protein n=1 Tax=Antribacter gilvus TaxID=2304675 RepID=UPI000F78BC2C|nr:hypothetical protein [Antribacter gilvus]
MSWRRRATGAATAMLLAGAFLAGGTAPAAGVSDQTASFSHLTVQGVPCSSTPVFVNAPAPDTSLYTGLVVEGAVNAAGGAQASTQLIRPDGGIIHTSRVGIGPDGEFRAFVDPRETDETVAYTIRVTTTMVGGGAGPTADCQIFVRSGPQTFPAVHPLLGAEAVYLLGSTAPRGGPGIAGAFVARSDEPGVVGFEYQMAPADAAFPEWTRVDGNPGVIPVLPETSGNYTVYVRAVDVDGLVGHRTGRQFGVAAPGEARPAAPSATVRDATDTDLSDGLTPASVVFSSDLRVSYGTIDLFRGETPIGTVHGDGRLVSSGFPITIDAGVLGQGIAEVRAEYRAFDGAPVVESVHHVCADSCEFASANARISGSAVPGAVLGAAMDTVPVEAAHGYQWFRDGVVIPGQTSSTYVVQLDDAEHEISVTVTGSRPRFTDVVDSASVVIPAPPAGHSLTIAYEEVDTDLHSRNGATLGVVGQSRPLHGFAVRLTNENAEGEVSATVPDAIVGDLHVSGAGWGGLRRGEDLGTSVGTSRIEAVQLELSGPMAERWDLYYRVHSQKLGWLGWAKNGATAGTTGYRLQVEALEVRLVAKGGTTPSGTLLAASYDPATSRNKVLTSAHVQTFGWMDPVQGGEIAGTTGLAKRVEALLFSTFVGSAGIEAQAHVQTYGWMPWASQGIPVGTTGEAKRVEAFRIRLTGDLAQQYDVYYRTHAQSFGWLGWAKNGAPSGTAGFAYRLEAVQVLLVPKGGPAPSGTGPAYYQR